MQCIIKEGFRVVNKCFNNGKFLQLIYSPVTLTTQYFLICLEVKIKDKKLRG